MRQILTIGTCLLVGILAMFVNHVSNIGSHSDDVNNIQFVQKVILKHEKRMNDIAENLIINRDDHHLHTHNTEDYSLYIFNNDTLVDWHNATIPNAESLSRNKKKVIETTNGWYYIIKKDSLLILNNNSPVKISAVVSLKLKNNYAYENEYLQPSFHQSFKASKNSLLSLTRYNDKAQAINNAKGEILFYFVPANSNENTDNYIGIIALCIWLTSMLTCITFTVKHIKNNWAKLCWLILSASAIYIWSTYISFPQPITTWSLFSSTAFAVDWWLPTLGHLTLLCGLITTITLLIYKHVSISNNIIRWILPTLIFITLCYVIDTIVFHSTDIIIYAGEIDIQPTTLVKIVCLTFLIISILFSIQWARKGNSFMTFQNYVWQIFLMSLFALLLTTILNHKKEYSSRMVLLSNITFQMTREDDPVAETLLISIEEQIATDSIIKLNINKNESHLYKHLRDYYFDGYFSRYDLQVIPCHGPDALLTLTTFNDTYNCYNYFDGMIAEYGNQIGERSNFYCLTDNDGQPSYIGIFDYGTSRLFIEINAKLNNDQLGYPELLTNSRDRMNYQQLEDYSYALYYNGKLSAQHGLLQYPQNNNWIDTTKTIHTFDNYTHMMSYPTKNHTIVVSYPSLTFNQFLENYSFLVLTIFIISIIILYTIRFGGINLFNISTIHDRIQYSFVLFILVLLIFFCAAQGHQTVKRYEDIAHKRLSETLTSISKVIQHDLPTINTREESDNLLWRTANTFMVDINLYSTNGRLIATSRRELFSSGIASSLINPEALSELRNPLSHDEIFIKENIGELQYYSLYTPISNEQGNVIGYINIPYFLDIKAKKETLLTSFVPITNIYMLFILIAIGLSYLIARSITKPLLAISDNIKKIALGKTNEKIDYPHNDEIGVLVNEYNRMLDELAYSAEKLAASERENTWREMARQIAHEIKNPLTPMKLSVQYLVKAWDNKRDDFDSFIRKVSNTLIEQIDQLSFVASEFSSLAKTTHGEKKHINIYERLQNTVNLWTENENLTITFSSNTKEAFILANGDQMTSVFNNLIKNAIQAMPTDRSPKIDITLTQSEKNILITVTDNGNGIPTDIQEKIFKPNFTTKSTGMGLGLAIVNGIILEHNGEISFTTKEGEFTTFSILLPLD